MEMNLNTLNTLRTDAGMKPLKAWKASKAAMTAAAEKLLHMKPKRTSEAVALKDLGKTALGKANEKSWDKTVTISVADIARAMNVDQKVARAKLRRLYASGTNGLPKPIGDGWTFNVGDESKLRELLTTDRRVHNE